MTSCAKLLGAEAQCTVVLCSLILHFQHSQVNPGSPRVRYTEKGQPYFSSQEPPTLSTRSPILGDGGELPSSFQVSAFSVVRKIKQMGENYPKLFLFYTSLSYIVLPFLVNLLSLLSLIGLFLFYFFPNTEREGERGQGGLLPFFSHHMWNHNTAVHRTQKAWLQYCQLVLNYHVPHA